MTTVSATAKVVFRWPAQARATSKPDTSGLAAHAHRTPPLKAKNSVPSTRAGRGDRPMVLRLLPYFTFALLVVLHMP